ncbi:uroporphyrinogen-III synthase [Candidatus Accumulibacter cognatus]|uniref:Uroporphyrinogen-III synthase n=1 Tax=Candidatus Accumulibacter cognatus TaxID=2954383 RepID=A0A080M7C7_9PROT|nr:uroporphyrinogen-III synthase [Candidatus Accumulibacter cognatus]KFB77143.1 MAG: Uroporphyrinogen-III synthase [Candidatus Accumulibacter cognatus]
MTQPLRGLTIVVTRPRAQASRLAGWIAEQGGEPLIFPLLEISPVIDPAPLQAAIMRLGDYSLAIFISPNAVDFSVPAILARQAWPLGLRAVAIGQSSVARLARYGIGHVLAPADRFDSEALLELPEMRRAGVAGKRVLIFRGNGGRELLADTLRERGAEVDAVSCYQRSAPADAAPLQALWRSSQLDALTISSSEGLRNLVGLLDAPANACLRGTPMFVPHQRIAELAHALAMRRVILTGAADAGIIAALCSHDWQRS